MRRRTFLAAALLASAWMLGVGPLAAQRPSAAEQSYLRTKARNYAEYKKTMELRANCSNNTVYADADGDIAYWHGNFIPRRDPRFDYTRPVDGGDPATNWRGLMTVDEAPHLLNPKSGYLFNVNDSPWNGAGASSLRKSDYPACVEQGIESARGLHAIRILAPDGAPRRDFSLDSLMRAAYDPYLPWFARTVPVLVSAYDAQPANSPLKSRLAREIALLRTWDDRWSADSVATSDRRTPLQTQMFLASVANSSNTAVTWGLSPAVGGISGSGVYTAPVAIATAQTVTATANSAANPTKKASAAIALTPGVSVSLTPTTAALGPSQTEAFLATVANSSNTSFTWSLSPAVGSISGSGVYTAPAAIATAQTVTATAPSAADSTKRASSRVTLASIPAPTSFPAPGAYTSTTSVTLSDGDSSAMIYYTTDGSTPSASSTRYTEAIPLSISATVRAIAINGSLNSAVTSGYYTISAPPAMVVTLTPTNAIIPVGLNQQFAAFVAGTQTTAVTWTLSGTGCSGKTCGTISSSGLYTAPAAVPSSATVTVTATSVAATQTTAEITIVPPQADGYSLAWEDTFSKLSLCTTNTPGCNWYNPGLWWEPAAGAITDPSGTHVNLEWVSGQANSTNISTASPNGAYSHSWTYGYFEVSMKFDPTTGSFPAIWMLPVSENGGPGENTNTNGINYGEIDLFEWQIQTPATFYGTVHVRNDQQEIANNNNSHAWAVPKGTNFANYNRYGVLWTPTSISWYFNNVLMETLSTVSSPYSTVFGGTQSYLLILSQQPGCNWTTPCPGQVSPLNMQVQWVHIYAPPPM